MENASKLGRSCYEKSKAAEFDDGVIKKKLGINKENSPTTRLSKSLFCLHAKNFNFLAETN